MTALLSQQGRVDRAFERIYRRHVGDVYRYALAVLRNPSDAEDVTQTTFMNAYRAFLRGERPRNAQNWLIAITHNVCRQRFRQSLRRPEEVEYDEGIGDLGPDEQEGPSAEDIQRALGQLAFNQRAALVMRELEGRSYAEIAEILGTSVSAVETLIFRARRALREQLGGSLTCGEAERAISRDLDGLLSRAEKSALRGHVRACKECQRFARSQRAQRRAIRALGVIPIPASLTSLFGGGGGAAAVGGGVAIKAAAAVAAGTIATGVGYEGVKRLDIARDAPERAAEVGATTPDAAIRAARPVALLPPFAVTSAPEQKAKASVRSKAKAKPAKSKSVSRRTAPKAPPGLTKKAVRAVPKAKAKAPSAKAKGPKLHARVPRRANPVQVKPKAARRVKVPGAKPKAVPPAKPGKRGHVR